MRTFSGFVRCAHSHELLVGCAHTRSTSTVANQDSRDLSNSAHPRRAQSATNCGGEIYPASTADISVDHPQVVENYRSAHEIALRIGKEAATTGGSENGDDSPPLSISLFEGLVQACPRRLKGKKWRNG